MVSDGGWMKGSNVGVVGVVGVVDGDEREFQLRLRKEDDGSYIAFLLYGTLW